MRHQIEAAKRFKLTNASQHSWSVLVSAKVQETCAFRILLFDAVWGSVLEKLTEHGANEHVDYVCDHVLERVAGMRDTCNYLAG